MKFTSITALAVLAATAIAAPTGGITTACIPSTKSGGLLSDLAPGVHNTLVITGKDSKQLLVKLSPSVTDLLSGLGLPELGKPVGEIVKTAGNVGDLLKDLGEPVENLLTVTGQDGGALLIKLSPDVKGLLSGLLPGIAQPVGDIVCELGHALKRDDAEASGKLVQDLAPEVNDVLKIVGEDTHDLLVKLSPDVAGLLSGLGLTGLAGPVGHLVYHASSVGDLIKHLGPSVEDLLAITGKDGGILLVKLSPSVAGLVAGLGLPTIATPVGNLLHVVGNSL